MKRHYIPLTALLAFFTALTSFAQAPPENNTCPSAFFINAGETCVPQTFTTQYATEYEPAGIWCSGIPDDDVWFRFFATSQRMEIQVTGIDDFDPTLQRFDGNCGDLTPHSCIDTPEPGGTETLIMDNLVIGQVYYFRVYDRLTVATQTSFLFELCITELDPIIIATTDFPCIAVLEENKIPADGAVRFYNNAANGVPDNNEAVVTPPSGFCDDYDYNGWCSNDPIQNSAWFAFDAPASGAVFIDLCNGGSTEILTQLALYSYTDCNDFNSFTFIAGNEVSPDCAPGSQLSACSLTPGETYLIMVDGFQAATGTFGGSITEINAPNAGVGTDIAICKNTPAYNLQDAVNGEDDGGFWVDVDNTGEVFNGVFNAQNTPPGNYHFIYVIEGFSCFENDSAFVALTTQPLPDAGDAGGVTACTNAPAFALIDQLNGSPETGGYWRDPSGALHTDSINPAIDDEGLYTYIIASSNGACPQDSGVGTVSVVIVAGLNAGTDTEISVCTNDVPFSKTGALEGNPDEGGLWIDQNFNPVVDMFDPAVDDPGIYIYSVTGEGCPDAFAVLTIFVQEGPDAGTEGGATLCFDDPEINMFTLLGGTPDAGGEWFDPEGNATDNMFNPAVDAPGYYVYKVSGAGCPDDSAEVLMEVIPKADAGTDNAVKVCINNTGFNLYNELEGTPQAGGDWMAPDGTGHSGFFVAANDLPGDYTYTVSTTCDTASAVVTVSIDPLADAGLAADSAVCFNAAPVDLFFILGGTPVSGGVWYAPDGSITDSIFNPATDAEGAYKYKVENLCGMDSTLVNMSLILSVNAGNSFNTDICENSAPVDLFPLLGPDADTGGEWTSSAGVFNGTIDPATWDPEDTEVLYTVTGTCDSDFSIGVLTFLPVLSAGTALPEDTVTWDNEPSVDLFTLVEGYDEGGTWNDDDASGGLSGSIFTSTEAMNQQTYHFTYTVVNACGESTTTVTVFVDKITGISELANNAFRIYPNPATRNLTIESTSALAGPVTIRIFDIAGKQVYSENNEISGNRLSLNLSLSPGKYILELSDGKTITGRQNLIIQ